MPRDELRQPLKRRSTAERLWSKRPGALMFVSVLTVAIYATAALWLSRIPQPFAGEPIITAQIPPLEEVPTASIGKIEASEAVDEAPPAEEVVESQESFDEVGTVKITGAQEPEIIIPAHRPMKAAPIAGVTEETSDGPLPKIGAGGKKPSDVYAAKVPMSALDPDQPKIVLLLGGMGLNARLTERAISELPGDISFGFAPYGANLQSQVNKARARGHEILLHLPLEPAGYPAINPGPNTLLSEQTPEENLASLRWNMTRFAGYSGITNYMGTRFLSSPEQLRPVLADVKKRGLVFLEDAGVASSSTDAVARIVGLAVRKGEIVIDANPDPENIADALQKLEDQAKRQGIAIGTGTGLEVTIEEVARWSKDLARRGIVLVPVSAAFKGRAG
jgi:polysaccharide deacetylase 2 family uncharacterized protein YibQ